MHSPTLHPRRTLAIILVALSLVGLALSHGELAGQGQGQGKGKGKGKDPAKAQAKDKGKDVAKAAPAPIPDVALPGDWVKAMTWRCIGPGNMSGRITAISVYEADPSLYWIASASGGLLKTVNNGVTFEHQFDREATVSIGDVRVAPSDPNIVWVGTGEASPRNSVSYGDGVYKSTDGGKSWKNMGLRESFQVSKVLVHPKDPNTVYVGALGRLYGPNAERGVFKSTDGGQRWDKVLFIDERTGIIDLVMHPTDPNTMMAAAWERWRDGHDSHPGSTPPEGYDGYDPMKKWGPGAGIYKTTDAGKTWTKLTKGLPTSYLGRIGLDWNYRKDPNVVFATVDCQKIAMRPGGTATLGIQGQDAGSDQGARIEEVTEGGPGAAAGLRANDVVKKAGDKPIKTYQELLDVINAAQAGGTVELEITRGAATQTVKATYAERPAPGARGGGGGQRGGGANRPFSAAYGGQAADIQDQQGPNGFEYGGLYKSTDGGESWTRINSVNPRPMYFSVVRVDPSDDNFVYTTGVGFNRSADGGKSFGGRGAGAAAFGGGRGGGGGGGIHSDHHALWINPKDGRHMIIGTDGGFYVTYDRTVNWDHMNHAGVISQFYHVALSNQKPYWVYGGLQDNGSWGAQSVSLTGRGPINEDWISVGGGDGFVCRVDPNDPDWVYVESQDGNMSLRNLKTGETGSNRPGRGGRGGAGGDPAGGGRGGAYRWNWNTPFILSEHNSKVFYCAGDYVFRSIKQGSDAQVISPEITRTKRGSATALAESPRNAEVLWVGTDDGALWVTRNGGREWTQVDEKVGLPAPRWVSTIEASRFAEGRAYVCFDAHRSDDDKPYLYMTEDYGQTWKNITNNLPEFGSSRCLREDIVNQNLLYCGTEFGIFTSTNRGNSWTKLSNNLPTVAVHEVAVHPTAGEIVAATHGRGIWILDVTALRQITAESVKEKPALYQPNTVTRYMPPPNRGRTNRALVGENPPPGAQIYYSLPKPAEKVALEVQAIDGTMVGRIMQVPTGAGLHRVSWQLLPGDQSPQPPAEVGRGGGRGGRGGGGPAAVSTGTYRVVLTVDGQTFVQALTVEGYTAPPPVAIGDGDDDDRDG